MVFFSHCDDTSQEIMKAAEKNEGIRLAEVNARPWSLTQ
jgi:hypothetical protein